MPEWVYGLPDDVITVLSIALVVGGVVVLSRLYRWLRGRRPDPAPVGPLLDSFRLVVTLTGLVLAFSLVQAQTNLRNVAEVLSREASTLDLAVRELHHFQQSDAAELHAHLIGYGEAIIVEEWPLLAHGRHSARLDGAYAELVRIADRIEPANRRQEIAQAELLKDLDQLAYLRVERIGAARARLLPAFWHAVEAMTLASMLLAAVIPRSLSHGLATLLPSAALAVLIALLIIIDVPFQGQSAVRPVAMQQVISQLEPNGMLAGP